jgi:hypothetical protein
MVIVGTRAGFPSAEGERAAGCAVALRVIRIVPRKKGATCPQWKVMRRAELSTGYASDVET